MKKIFALTDAVAVFLAGCFVGTACTIQNLTITTDGDCDAAIVTICNHSFLYGANGYNTDTQAQPID